jgi:Asp-tRNA(Asn)/Glu-tRNA(Gln) amidotransferase A subunit family amidase
MATLEATALKDAAVRRWGAADGGALAPSLERLAAALATVGRQPCVEPGSWPPAPLPRAMAPHFTVPSARSGHNLTDAGVMALAGGIAEGRISPVEVISALLERSSRLQPELESWALLDGERALAAARQRESDARAGVLRGPLHGVPLGVKDIIDVAGLPTRANSRLRAEAPAAADDAEAVARLRAAGAIVLGKTATTEFAMADPSPARNPWRPAHTPGGSSSGSAAAVAARLVPGALGSQTAGSVLRPAAFCGVVGFKPSAGRISRVGVLPLAWSLDHVGTLTRSVADAAALFAVMAGAGEEPAEPRPPRLGFAPAFLSEHTDDATRAALHTAAATLERDGAEITPLDLDELGPVALDAQHVIMAAEVAAVHLGAHSDRLAAIGPRLRAQVQAGALVPAGALLRAQGVRRLLWQRWDPYLRGFDAVIVPAAAGAAPQGLASTGDPALNAPWTLLGVPAIAIPITVTEVGLPLGMQLVAPFGEDARLLRAAAWCERALGFSERPAL